MSLFRLATAGSVDDGKSTLVGRLLYDSKAILTDTYAAVEQVSTDRGLQRADLALLTDGLRAEREQGITIDVAYRYFSTGRRTFVLADCPGHVQYTRNTVTGASTADAVVVLVDIRHGIQEQTRRHLAVAALLRVPHVILAANKIDLVGYAEEPYRALAAEVAALASALGLGDTWAVPVSALEGDNVVDASVLTPWYHGPTLIELLETLPVVDAGADEAGGFRFPVQTVIRPQEAAVSGEYRDYRGYGGQVAAGSVRVGAEVVVLPSGSRTSIAGIDTPGGALAEARAGRSVSLRLTDDVDVSRGDLIAAAVDAPTLVREVTAHLCWLAARELGQGDRVLFKHGTRTVQAIVAEIVGVLDLALPGGTLESSLTGVGDLGLNDIGLVRLRLAEPVPVEPYSTHRRTGAFCLLDPHDGNTLGAGMVVSPTR